MSTLNSDTNSRPPGPRLIQVLFSSYAMQCNAQGMGELPCSSIPMSGSRIGLASYGVLDTYVRVNVRYLTDTVLY